MESKAEVGDVVIVASNTSMAGVPAILTQEIIDSGDHYWIPTKQDIFERFDTMSGRVTGLKAELDRKDYNYQGTTALNRAAVIKSLAETTTLLSPNSKPVIAAYKKLENLIENL